MDERYSYDAFGPVRFLDASFAVRSSSICAWNFLFHAEFMDVESGIYNYGYRFYNPYLGRWLSRDPIGEEGGINLYSILMNNGISRVDALGLQDRQCKIPQGQNELVINFSGDEGSFPKLPSAGSWKEFMERGQEKKNSCPEDCLKKITIIAHGTPGVVETGGSVGQIDASQLLSSAKFKKLMAEVKKLLCPGGKIHFASCNSFRGEAGEQLEEELEKIFGEGNVQGHDAFVSVDGSGNTGEISDLRAAWTSTFKKGGFEQSIQDPGRYIPPPPRPPRP